MILFIDDDADFLNVMFDSLELRGYQVLTAQRGIVGVELAREHLPDVILCDLLMPELNGFEVRALLKTDQRTARIPFIFLTGVDGREMPDQTRYIAKPFKIDQLIDCVREALEQVD